MTANRALPDHRPRVWHMHARGQPIHLLAAQAAPGTTPATPLTWVLADRSMKSADVKAFLLEILPAGTGPQVVALDNASTHRHGAMQNAGPALAQAGITLKFLPPCSSQLNDMERTFRTCQHEGLPQRSFADRLDLAGGVNQAFENVHNRFLNQDQPKPQAEGQDEQLI